MLFSFTFGLTEIANSSQPNISVILHRLGDGAKSEQSEDEATMAVDCKSKDLHAFTRVKRAFDLKSHQRSLADIYTNW